jgi:hypothetical protein
VKKKPQTLIENPIFPPLLLGVRKEFKKAIKAKSKEMPKDDAPHLYLQANGRLRDLLQLTKKFDREAARYLLSLLTNNVERFLNLCSKNPKLAHEIQFPGEPWPLLHTQLKVNEERYLTVPNSHVLRKLGIIRKGRTFSEEAVGTRVAIQLYCEMDFYRRILPQKVDRGQLLHPLLIEPGTDGKCKVTPKPNEKVSAAWTLDSLARDAIHAEQIRRIRALKTLSRRNYVDWWKAAEPLFLERWGHEFQGHPDFKGWGAARYLSLKPNEAKSAKRRDIKNAVKRGFKSLASSQPV